jgi:hypothetical protein
MVAMLKNREWAEDLAATGDAAELQSAITKLLPNQTMHPDDAAVLRWADAMADKMARSRAKERSGWHDTNRCTAEQLNTMLADHLGKGDPLDVAILAMMLWSRSERTTPAQQAAPDAVDAAMVDAITHGTGAFQVKADGSTEHVELSKEDQRHYAELAAFPPKLQRDALYQDYAVPKADPRTSWAQKAARQIEQEYRDTAAIETANYMECGFILAAAQVAQQKPDVARQIGALMEPPRDGVPG